jgi:hypothetical protein
VNIIKLGFLGLLSAVALLSVRAYMKNAHPDEPGAAVRVGQGPTASTRAFVEILCPMVNAATVW